MSKKVLSVVLACMMLLSAISCVAFAKTSAEADTHLQFNENGEFKILQIADMQDGFPMKLITKNLIKKAIETENGINGTCTEKQGMLLIPCAG